MMARSLGILTAAAFVTPLHPSDSRPPGLSSLSVTDSIAGAQYLEARWIAPTTISSEQNPFRAWLLLPRPHVASLDSIRIELLAPTGGSVWLPPLDRSCAAGQPAPLQSTPPVI